MRRSAFRSLYLGLLSALVLAPLLAAQASIELLQAQQLIDSGDPEAAMIYIQRALKKDKKDPQALLLRSTARLMSGEMEAGRKDLARALKLDPRLRQGWLNRAALDISEQRYGEALAALRKAEELDPSAPDNGLNLGAVLLMQGKPEEAAGEFESYLQANRSSAESFYLVATNYAMAGHGAASVDMLGKAIVLDERSRLQARSDANFRGLLTDEGFKALLEAPPKPPGAGAHHRRALFEGAYDGGRGPLLEAVLDALQLSGASFDPRVETTERWAMIWGEIRIVLRQAEGSQGLVELIADRNALSEVQWKAKTDELLREIQVHLAAGSLD